MIGKFKKAFQKMTGKKLKKLVPTGIEMRPYRSSLGQLVHAIENGGLRLDVLLVTGYYRPDFDNNQGVADSIRREWVVNGTTLGNQVFDDGGRLAPGLTIQLPDAAAECVDDLTMADVEWLVLACPDNGQLICAGPLAEYLRRENTRMIAWPEGILMLKNSAGVH
jgi:hypothetical protein